MKKLLIPLLLSSLSLTGCEKSTDEVKVEGRWYTQSQVDTGRQLFADNCAECHGKDAQGTANWKETLADGSYPAPPLNGTAHAWHHALSALRRSITNGGIPLGGKMPPFKDKLNEHEMDAVIAYFQSKWDDKIYAAWSKRGGVDVSR